MSKHTGVMVLSVLILLMVLAVVVDILHNVERGDVCRQACHPVVSKLMDKDCYCADGDDWKLKYRDSDKK